MSVGVDQSAFANYEARANRGSKPWRDPLDKDYALARFCDIERAGLGGESRACK